MTIPIDLAWTDLILLPALLLLFVGLRCMRRRRFGWGGATLLLTLPVTVFAGYWLWYVHRPQPPADQRELASGVVYRRESRMLPRPVVIHVVNIDLTTPGLEFFVTPGESAAEYPVQARKTSRFVEEFDQLVAINASFFHPFHANSLLDYYPHTGDPVRPVGSCTSRRTWYSAPADGYTLLWITEDNRAGIGGPGHESWNGVSGKPVLLRARQKAEGLDEDATPQPRTAVALNQGGTRMFWFVIDGRQPGYSEGLTLDELAGLCREFGASDALAFDGGGSSTVAGRGPDGRVEVWNYPIHGTHPPGCERPVATHLGLRVRAGHGPAGTRGD